MNEDRNTGAARAGFVRAGVLLGVRIASVVVLAVLTWGMLRGLYGIDEFPPNIMWATLGLLPVNIVCLWLVRRHLRADGRTFAEALGVQRGRIGRDVLWGLLWLLVLNVPFMLAVTGTVFAMYGADAPQAFETIF